MSTTILVTKNDKGELEGVGQKCRTALLKFNRWLARLEPGEIFTLEVWFPRNPKFTALHFVMLGMLFDRQEQFSDAEHLRIWLQTGAGYAKFYPGPTGKQVAIPDSISYAKMDDGRFSEHHDRIKEFMRSEYCQAYLWPHLDAFARSEMVEGVLREIEDEQLRALRAAEGPGRGRKRER